MGDETEEGLGGMSEGGEGGESGEATTDTAPVASSDGGMEASVPSEPDYAASAADSTSIDSLNFEVKVLSMVAVDRVTDEIARRIEPIARDRKLKGVVIADPGSISAMRAHATLMGQIAGLEAQVEAAKTSSGDDGGMQAGLVGTAVVNTAIGAARSLATNVGNLLKIFESTTTYRGVDVTLANSVLHAALAKHIAGRGVVTQVPRYSVSKGTGSEVVDRLLKLQGRCQSLAGQGAESGDLTEILSRINNLVNALFPTNVGGDGLATSSGPAMMQQLAEAEMLASAIDKGFGLLTVELTASGGSYRLRKWILNGLLGRDSLTYSGGAAVTYFLLGGESMAALASDTVYFATGHGSFGNKYQRFSPTNIPGLERY